MVTVYTIASFMVTSFNLIHFDIFVSFESILKHLCYWNIFSFVFHIHTANQALEASGLKKERDKQ